MSGAFLYIGRICPALPLIPYHILLYEFYYHRGIVKTVGMVTAHRTGYHLENAAVFAVKVLEHASVLLIDDDAVGVAVEHDHRNTVVDKRLHIVNGALAQVDDGGAADAVGGLYLAPE